MKRPRQLSTEPDLPSGKVKFSANAAFTTTRITVARPIPGTLNDVVVCSLDNHAGIFPYTNSLSFYGGVDSAGGSVEIYLINHAAPVNIPDIYINWMVLPGGST
jgi:hypothetical protein